MKIKQLGSNQVEVVIPGKARVLFSYNTPVAAFIEGRGWVKTNRFYSVTTSKHINKYLQGLEYETVEQSELDELVS
jgi:hypothetical protein